MRREPLEIRWHRVDDDQVSEVPWSVVKEQNRWAFLFDL